MDERPPTLDDASGDSPTSAPAIGEVLAGKYVVEGILGAGGMGVVVKARHLELQTTFAVKLLARSYVDSAEAIARFGREARAAARLGGEHVVRTVDAGTLVDGRPYITMEHIAAPTLAAHLAEHGAYETRDAVALLLELCEGVAEAHVAGIVHRDLKPSNVLLARRADGSRCAKILDFGISKAPGTRLQDASLTQASDTLGTPGYMAPEQSLAARDVDARADVWSLGVILYELVSGRSPFGNGPPAEVIARVLRDDPPALPPAASQGLVEVSRRCLRKEREERFPDVLSLARALAPFTPRGAEAADRVGRIVGDQAVLAGGQDASASTEAQAARDESIDASAIGLPRRRPRRALAWVALGTLAALLALAVLRAMGSWSGATSSPGAAATDPAVGTTSPRGAEVVPPQAVTPTAHAQPSASTVATVAASILPVPMVRAAGPVRRAAPLGSSASPAPPPSAPSPHPQAPGGSDVDVYTER